MTSRLKILGVAAFGLLVVVGALEVALRGLATFQLWRSEASLQTAWEDGSLRRILCIGESTTFGTPFTTGSSYPAQLQKILDERFQDTRFRVINRGIPAINTMKIVRQLPGHLEKYDPDVVIAMMGVNDFGTIDPTMPVGGSVRVWKLATSIFWALRGRWLEPGAPVGAVPRQVGSLHRMQWKLAGDRLIEGRFDEAEQFLAPIVDWPDPIFQGRALGMQAILAWQRGDQQQGEAHHRRFREWHRRHYDARTRQSYAEIRRILAARGVLLVAMQYPGQPIEGLELLVEPGPGVVLLDNEEVFLERLRTRPAKETYRDLFGGIFGHMTTEGHRVLAENVATLLLSVSVL